LASRQRIKKGLYQYREKISAGCADEKKLKQRHKFVFQFQKGLKQIFS
jgi:hypothetical protein